MPHCAYKYEPYYRSTRFTCKEECRTNSKFCIFHDKDHYAQHEKEAIDRFQDIVAESLSKGSPLECIGFYLPRIDCASLPIHKTFSQPVYFNNATFYRAVNFFRVSFSKEANFDGATFSDGAKFSGASFSDAVYFSKATFSKEARFHKASFYKEAYFIKSSFSDGASFDQGRFLDEAFFIRNIFNGKIVFSYTRFEQPNKVTFDQSDLSNISFGDTNISRIRFGHKTRGGMSE